MLMRQFRFPIDGKTEIVKEGDTRCFGAHTVTFVEAPMVHWPEAMVTYDTTNGVLFAADAFGSFGALDGKLFNDEVNFDRDWIDDARRYYTNIVGKYGPHVQALLKKASGIDIKMICPLHGPVWRTDLGYLIDKYDKWSRYEPEEKGVLIVYASMYGNTENAARILATKLVEKGLTNIAVYDVSNTHVSYLISESFRYSHIVLASVTYNLGMYPLMHNYLMDMKALNLQKRKVAIMENGSWAVKSGTRMQDFLEGMKQMEVLDTKLTISSALRDENLEEMDALAGVNAVVSQTCLDNDLGSRDMRPLDWDAQPGVTAAPTARSDQNIGASFCNQPAIHRLYLLGHLRIVGRREAFGLYIHHVENVWQHTMADGMV